jgi:hypothetical protein
MRIQDKKYLPETYRKTIGNAIVTGYCIKFKNLKDINIDTLEPAIQDGVKQITIPKKMKWHNKKLA